MNFVIKHRIELGEVQEQSLQQILGNEIQGRDKFELTESLVRDIVLSRYQKRKESSQILLNCIYGKIVNVHIMPDNDRIYAYINFYRDKKYIFVSTYPSKRVVPFIEQIPDKEEMVFWKKTGVGT